jgi:putative inorganic carbon (HCO3(-)) transporter
MQAKPFLKRIEFIILLVPVLVPFVYVPVWSVLDFFYYPKYLALLGIVSILLVMVALNAKMIGLLFKWDWINRLVLIYFALLTISLFFAHDLQLSLGGQFLRYDGYVTQMLYLFLFLFARLIKKIPAWFIEGIVIGSAILAFYALLQANGFELFTRDLTRMHWTKPFATFGNPNFFGAYLVLILPWHLYLILFKYKVYAYFTYALVFYVLLINMTRSAWIGFIASLIFAGIMQYIFKHPIRKKEILFVVFISLTLILFYNLSSDQALLGRFLSISSDFNALVKKEGNLDALGSFRLYIWVRVIEIIKDYPLFGVGIENLHIVFMERFNQDSVAMFGRVMIADKAHNEYLHLAVTSGIPSLIAYLVFLIKTAMDNFKQLKDPMTYVLASAIFGYCVQAFFNISVVSVAYIFWVYLGLLNRYTRDFMQA